MKRRQAKETGRQKLATRWNRARVAYNASLREERRLERLLEKQKKITQKLAVREEGLSCDLDHYVEPGRPRRR